MESDGETGVVGSGIGRVEYSICEEIEEPMEETVKDGYQVGKVGKLKILI